MRCAPAINPKRGSAEQHLTHRHRRCLYAPPPPVHDAHRESSAPLSYHADVHLASPHAHSLHSPSYCCRRHTFRCHSRHTYSNHTSHHCGVLKGREVCGDGALHEGVDASYRHPAPRSTDDRGTTPCHRWTFGRRAQPCRAHDLVVRVASYRRYYTSAGPRVTYRVTYKSPGRSRLDEPPLATQCASDGLAAVPCRGKPKVSSGMTPD
jgi:hypothetical protein